METTPTETSSTKPIAEHAWLAQLVGEWHTESEMLMEPGSAPAKGSGRESVTSLGGLWAFAEGETQTPDGR